MTSSSDVSNASTQPTTNPSPSSQPSSGPSTNPWSGSDFQATMNRLAAERRDEPAPREGQVLNRTLSNRPNVGKDDEDEDKDGRDQGGGTGAERLNARDGQGEVAKDARADGRLEGLFNHTLPQLPAALAFDAPAGAGAADIEAFAAAMEKAWVNAGGGDGKQVSLRFVDPFSPLAGIGVSRLANGTLALQLSAQAHSQPELSRTLDALKKRMEARGLQVAEVTFSEDDGEFERLIPKVR